LPFIGPKIARLASAYIKTGTIPEVKATLASGRFVALCLLSSIYGIGPTTARVLYARGVRTIRDLCSWYDVDPDTPPPKAEGLDVDTSTSSPQNAEDGTKDQEHLIRAALVFRADLEIKIERAEVEASYALVAEELEEIQSGCISTICGGYRRGKLLSNDVDIVLTHPDTDVGKGLCQRIVERLVSKGIENAPHRGNND
jgi:DNA polymerase IV